MPEIHGLASHAAGATLLPFKYDPGELPPTEIEVKVSHCGISHTDIHLIDHDWGISKYPLVPGHEIVGTVTAIGSSVADRTVGERVGIGWQAGSCGICEWCRQGDVHLCPQAALTCVGRHGGFAESVRVSSRFAVPIPEALPSDTSAPLLSAGVTVYSPLRRHRIGPYSRVGIIGIGGLGHLALQFARAFGAEVTAFSTSRDKEPEALKLGAHHFVNTQGTGALKKLAGSFDLLISTVDHAQDWPGFLAALRPRGVLHFVGVPPKAIQLQADPLIDAERIISGSPIGNLKDLYETLDVAARHNIKTVVEPFPLSKANDAITRLRKNQIRFRAVLAI